MKLSIILFTGLCMVMCFISEGQNWQRIQTPTQNDLTQVIEVHDSILMATDFNGDLYRTSNTGINWNTIGLKIFGLKKILFTPSETGHAMGFSNTGGSVYKRTTDYGLNWSDESNRPLISNLGANDFDFVTADEGLFVTGIGSGGSIARTNDGGNTWTSTYSANYTLNAVKFVNKQTAYAVGNSRFLLSSSDSGKTWGIFKDLGATFGGGSVLHFINDSVGFIGSGNRIYQTTDRGSSWAKITLPTTLPISHISFINPDTGFVLTMRSLFYTFDSGLSWLQDTTLPKQDTVYFDLFTDSDSTLFIASRGGIVLKRNFKPSTSGVHIVESPLNSFQVFPNPSNGRFYLETPFAGHYQIQIYDALGQLIFDKITFNDQTIRIEPSLQAGNYLLEIKDIQNGLWKVKGLIIK